MLNPGVVWTLAFPVEVPFASPVAADVSVSSAALDVTGNAARVVVLCPVVMLEPRPGRLVSVSGLRIVGKASLDSTDIPLAREAVEALGEVAGTADSEIVRFPAGVGVALA